MSSVHFSLKTCCIYSSKREARLPCCAEPRRPAGIKRGGCRGTAGGRPGLGPVTERLQELMGVGQGAEWRRPETSGIRTEVAGPRTLWPPGLWRFDAAVARLLRVGRAAVGLPLRQVQTTWGFFEAFFCLFFEAGRVKHSLSAPVVGGTGCVSPYPAPPSPAARRDAQQPPPLVCFPVTQVISHN